MFIDFGYCCITKLSDLMCSRSSTKTYLEKMSFDDARHHAFKKAVLNLADLKDLLKQNYNNGINAYRISDSLIPHFDLGYYKIEELEKKLVQVGEIANKYNSKLSIHPSQYFVLNSQNEKTATNTINFFNGYAKIFKFMKLQNKPTIVTHIGGLKPFDNKEGALKNFILNFNRLSDDAKSFVVVENDQNLFDINDCMAINKVLNIPVVFDSCHYHFNKGGLQYSEALNFAYSTWKDRTPKIHLSSENEKIIHAHSDFIDVKDYFQLENALIEIGADNVVVMLECKQKDKAVLKLREDIKNKK